MTGFARASGARAPYRWAFELKSVNAKGLDLRLRTPLGFDRIEGEARARLGRALARGTCFATLTMQREGAALQARVNAPVLAAIVNAVKQAAEGAGLAPPTLDGVLAIKGVVEVVETDEDEGELAAACEGALATLDEAIGALLAARRTEGAALTAIVNERLAAIAALTKAADENPARRATDRARLRPTKQARRASRRAARRRRR